MKFKIAEHDIVIFDGFKTDLKCCQHILNSPDFFKQPVFLQLFKRPFYQQEKIGLFEIRQQDGLLAAVAK